MNDHDLLLALKNGDRAAIKQIYTSYHKPLSYFASGFVKNKKRTEYIVVEIFIKLLRDRNKIERIEEINGFLYTATKNRCLDYLKHLRRKTTSHKEIILLMENDEAYIQSRITKAELLRSVLKEVENLPALQKKIFTLIFVDGLNTSKVAERLNITIDTVRVQKAKAIASLHSTFLKDKLLLAAF